MQFKCLMKFSKETWDKNTHVRARARAHTHTYIYSFINCLDKKHGYLWVNLELKYESLGYNNFFKHLGLSVSRPLSFEILAPSLPAMDFSGDNYVWFNDYYVHLVGVMFLCYHVILMTYMQSFSVVYLGSISHLM